MPNDEINLSGPGGFGFKLKGSDILITVVVLVAFFAILYLEKSSLRDNRNYIMQVVDEMRADHDTMLKECYGLERKKSKDRESSK